MCFRCASTNPLVSGKGDACVTCGGRFVRSFVTFEHLPLVEFGGRRGHLQEGSGSSRRSRRGPRPNAAAAAATCWAAELEDVDDGENPADAMLNLETRSHGRWRRRTRRSCATGRRRARCPGGRRDKAGVLAAPAAVLPRDGSGRAASRWTKQETYEADEYELSRASSAAGRRSRASPSRRTRRWPPPPPPSRTRPPRRRSRRAEGRPGRRRRAEDGPRGRCGGAEGGRAGRERDVARRRAAERCRRPTRSR